MVTILQTREMFLAARFSLQYQAYLSILTYEAPIPQNGQTLKQFVDNLPTKRLSVFDPFVKLTLKG